MDVPQQVSLAEITAYLRTKISGTNKRNTKANAACVMLLNSNGWDEKLHGNVIAATQILQTFFSRGGTDNPIGICKLTAAAQAMGEMVCENYGITDATWQATGRMGCLLVEAYYQCGFIYIYRDPGYSQHSDQAPRVLEVTEKWCQIKAMPNEIHKLFRATTLEPAEHDDRDVVKTKSESVHQLVREEPDPKPVSYTHLTLPTICSV